MILYYYFTCELLPTKVSNAWIGICYEYFDVDLEIAIILSLSLLFSSVIGCFLTETEHPRCPESPKREEA